MINNYAIIFLILDIMEDLHDFMNEKCVVKSEYYKAVKDSIICLICMDIIVDPIMCVKCQNVYCKKCIENWDRVNKQCPIKCPYTKYRKCRVKAEILNKLKFECKKCKDIIDYENMPKHVYSDCNKIKINNDYYKENSLQFNGIFQKIEDKSIKTRKTMEIKIKSRLNIIFYNLIIFSL